MEKGEIVEFMEKMKPRDHVILLYTGRRDKHDALFAYLKAGLERGEVTAYVASQEPPEEIRRDWYMIDGKFDASRTHELWKGLLDESLEAGFRGLRVAGEMACFFEEGLVEELLEYERSLHTTLEIPMTAICAYDSELVAREGGAEVLRDLLNSHMTAIITEPKKDAVKMEGEPRTQGR
ncbi:MAG: MEDS domain-containing protein [Thermoplasmata archaeon]